MSHVKFSAILGAICKEGALDSNLLMKAALKKYGRQVKNMKTDVLIVGSGCSGLYAALNLPEDLDIMMISKSDFESSDSFIAQGGMCTMKHPSDYVMTAFLRIP